VNKSVDGLCRTALNCCVLGGILGILAPDLMQNSAFSWKNAIDTLWIEKTRICPHATPEWLANKPNIYRMYIKL
jgi:hypothetical protein